jgi:hypothetical protein
MAFAEGDGKRLSGAAYAAAIEKNPDKQLAIFKSPPTIKKKKFGS